MATRKKTAKTRGVTRRQLLTRGSLAGAALALPSMGLFGCIAAPPFRLGVASGDPTSRSVVLWTRLAPDPLNGGGMDPVPVRVDWEVATDPAMTNVIRNGAVMALAESAHSVRVDVLGLPSDSWLWYRFTAEDHASTVGRTRTFPDPGTNPTRMRYVLASCQNYGDGHYSAYRNIALEPDVDFVVHVGDYVYGLGTGPVRTVTTPPPVSLDDYRNRYALYKLDPSLQAAHAAFPFIHTWDDHEVADGYGGVFDSSQQTSPAFVAQRAAAYQANYEHLPLGSSTAIGAAGSRLYRRFRFGDLAQILALDTRGFRSNKVCVEPFPIPFAPLCAEAADSNRTFLGLEQEAWASRRLARSNATWNVMTQGVMVMELVLDIPGLGPSVNLDSWAGYPTARARLLNEISASGARNPIVHTGDFHSSWVADLSVNSFDENAPIVGTEFVGPSITTAPPLALAASLSDLVAAHPHVQYANVENNGYVLFDVDEDRCRADYRVVADVLSPDASVSTLQSFEIPDGGVVAPV